MTGRVVGVDGCPSGWVCVGLPAPGGCEDESSLSWDWSVHARLPDLLSDRGDAALLVIDVPIGLTDGPPRPCDQAARRLLGPRRASVFTPPMRGMLGLPSRAAATAYGQARRAGGGLSAQTWNIVPKIEEADRTVSPERQACVREGHPEVAFARLAGGPLPVPKRTLAGGALRRRVLTGAGLDADALLRAVRGALPRRAVADDDVLDAAALALTARAVLAGGAIRLGGERDATGRVMEILG